MALNKDTLGNALYLRSMDFNDQDIAPADLPTARQNFWKAVAEEIINHIKTAGVVNVTVATTGTAAAQTGSGTGTMS